MKYKLCAALLAAFLLSLFFVGNGSDEYTNESTVIVNVTFLNTRIISPTSAP